MKRNLKKVPGFDEIIFENRNRKYGAFCLRKHYKSVTSLSIFGAVALSTSIVLALFFATKPGNASTGPLNIVIAQFENLTAIVPDQPVPKLPPELLKPPQNIVPEVVSDTTIVTSYLPITDEIIRTTTNGDVNDTIIYAEVVQDIVPAEPQIFIWVEEMPEFPGGNTALLSYIGKNTSYPVEAIENNIEGRVILRFVVMPDGTVGDVEILKGVDPLLDKEALRVVGTLPLFKPGKQNGKPVRVWYSVPVLFRITR
jgi:protein TonB